MDLPDQTAPPPADPAPAAHGPGGSKPHVTMMAIASPADPRTWSGTPHYVMRQLKRHFPVSILETPRTDTIVNNFARMARPLGWDPFRETAVQQLYRRLTLPMLEREPPDLLFSVMGTHKILRLPRQFPIIVMSDALFGTMVGYYAYTARMGDRSRRRGNAQQQAMIDRASAIMLTSEWAADDARAKYSIPDSTRLIVAPIGPNMLDDPGAEALARRANGDPATASPRLLFIGFDWERKGGPDVLRLHALLRRDFPDLGLDIVGCTPAEAAGRDGVTVHGVLAKSDPAQYARLKELYADAVLFVMLSRQEAYGIVYAEAASYGLPSVALDTGGVSTLVADGDNGFLFPRDTPIEAIAARIAGLLRDPAAHAAMRARARRRFETRLNWNSWGETAAEAIETAIRDWPAKAAWLANR